MSTGVKQFLNIKDKLLKQAGFVPTQTMAWMQKGVDKKTNSDDIAPKLNKIKSNLDPYEAKKRGYGWLWLPSDSNNYINKANELTKDPNWEKTLSALPKVGSTPIYDTNGNTVGTTMYQRVPYRDDNGTVKYYDYRLATDGNVENPSVLDSKGLTQEWFNRYYNLQGKFVPKSTWDHRQSQLDSRRLKYTTSEIDKPYYYDPSAKQSKTFADTLLDSMTEDFDGDNKELLRYDLANRLYAMPNGGATVVTDDMADLMRANRAALHKEWQDIVNKKYGKDPNQLSTLNKKTALLNEMQGLMDEELFLLKYGDYLKGMDPEEFEAIRKLFLDEGVTPQMDMARTPKGEDGGFTFMQNLRRDANGIPVINSLAKLFTGGLGRNTDSRWATPNISPAEMAMVLGGSHIDPYTNEDRTVTAGNSHSSWAAPMRRMPDEIRHSGFFGDAIGQVSDFTGMSNPFGQFMSLSGLDGNGNNILIPVNGATSWLLNKKIPGTNIGFADAKQYGFLHFIPEVAASTISNTADTNEVQRANDYYDVIGKQNANSLVANGHIPTAFSDTPAIAPLTELALLGASGGIGNAAKTGVKAVLNTGRAAVNTGRAAKAGGNWVTKYLPGTALAVKHNSRILAENEALTQIAKKNPGLYRRLVAGQIQRNQPTMLQAIMHPLQTTKGIIGDGINSFMINHAPDRLLPLYARTRQALNFIKHNPLLTAYKEGILPFSMTNATNTEGLKGLQKLNAKLKNFGKVVGNSASTFLTDWPSRTFVLQPSIQGDNLDLLAQNELNTYNRFNGGWMQHAQDLLLRNADEAAFVNDYTLAINNDKQYLTVLNSFLQLSDQYNKTGDPAIYNEMVRYANAINEYLTYLGWSTAKKYWDPSGLSMPLQRKFNHGMSDIEFENLKRQSASPDDDGLPTIYSYFNN